MTPEEETAAETFIYRLAEPKPDPRIIVVGTVTVRETEVEVSGWTVEGMTMQELGDYAVQWAEDRLGEVPLS